MPPLAVEVHVGRCISVQPGPPDMALNQQINVKLSEILPQWEVIVLFYYFPIKLSSFLCPQLHCVVKRRY